MTPVVTITGYAVLGLAAVALQVLAMRSRASGSRLPTAQSYLAAVMRGPVGRWTVLALWVWTGWHFFVR
jgi:hypothetical protein